MNCNEKMKEKPNIKRKEGQKENQKENVAPSVSESSQTWRHDRFSERKEHPVKLAEDDSLQQLSRMKSYEKMIGSGGNCREEQEGNMAPCVKVVSHAWRQPEPDPGSYSAIAGKGGEGEKKDKKDTEKNEEEEEDFWFRKVIFHFQMRAFIKPSYKVPVIKWHLI